MTITVVFDLDHTLTDCRLKELMPQNHKYLYLHGMRTEAVVPHYFFPGVIELIKALFETEGVNIGFFSGGESHRIPLLVENLLTLSLGKEVYAAHKNSFKVFCGDDLVIQDKYTKVKDLRKFVTNDVSLENIILVDDDSDNVAKGQKWNFLHVSACQATHYSNPGFLHEYPNTLFSFAQRIFEIIDIHKAQGKSAQEIICNIFKPKEFTTAKEERNYIDFFCNKKIQLKNDGLKRLQQINPNLQLFNKKTHEACVNEELSAEQRSELRQFTRRCEELCSGNECVIS